MYFLLLLIIAIPSFVSLLNPWYFSMHDFQHVARLFLLDRGLHQGYLFPRWVDLLGFHFGYPLFNFYPPLVYYISEIFRLMGLSYIWSIKSMIILGYCLGAVGMYKLSSKLIGSQIASLIATALFTFFTYHATLVFVRGAFAEFFGMNILPYAFLSLELLKEKPTLKRAVFFGSTLALLILSHVFIAFPFIFFFFMSVGYSLLFTKHKINYLRNTILGGLLGAGMSAFFWLPSMLERRYTLVDEILTKELASYIIHFVQPLQLWYSPWGYGGSGGGLADGMSFQLGKFHIGLAVLSLILFLFLLLKKKIDKLYTSRFALYVVMLLFSLFMMTEYSQSIWKMIPPLQYLQFPWRFLSFTGVFIAVLGGFAFQFLTQCFKTLSRRKMILWIVGSLIIGGTVMQYQKYFQPERYVYKSDQELTELKEITWNVSSSSFEFSPKGVPLKKSQYNTSVFDLNESEVQTMTYAVKKGRAEVENTKNDFNYKLFTVHAKKPSIFQLNTFNFPGWTARIDGGILPIRDDNRYKLISVQVPTGEHSLEFRFEDTPVRKWANITSGLLFVVAGLLLSTGKLKKREA